MESRALKAVGVWFLSRSTRRYLYLLRNDAKNPGAWGLPGGKIESGETLIDGIRRECCEELGTMPNYLKLVPLEKFTTADAGFEYHTFFCVVNSEFKPELNHEHLGYAWLDSGTWPKPMHPGLWSTVNIDAIKEKLRAVEHRELSEL